MLTPPGVLELGTTDFHATPEPAGHPAAHGVHQRRRPSPATMNPRPISNQVLDRIRAKFTLPALEHDNPVGAGCYYSGHQLTEFRRGYHVQAPAGTDFGV